MGDFAPPQQNPLHALVISMNLNFTSLTVLWLHNTHAYTTSEWHNSILFGAAWGLYENLPPPADHVLIHADPGQGVMMYRQAVGRCTDKLARLCGGGCAVASSIHTKVGPFSTLKMACPTCAFAILGVWHIFA